MTPSVAALKKNVQTPVLNSSRKVTIVGAAGAVGLDCAKNILSQGIASEIALIDVPIDAVQNKLMGELMDLQHSVPFLTNVKITAGSDYAISAGSKICVVSAGARQNEGESRLNLVQRNANIMKNIIPNLVKYSPDTILLIVSNPVDLMTYIAWKLSGLPKHRVIGSGTNLDSSRFRFLLSQRFDVAPSAINGLIIGEHGDTSVALWSGVSAGGKLLRDLNPAAGTAKDTEKWSQVHTDVVESAYQMIKLKGYTSWAIGSSVADISRAILNNTKEIKPVSTFVQDVQGIKVPVFLSLPCVLGEHGITDIINLTLTDEERVNLHKSAETLHEVETKLDLKW